MRASRPNKAPSPHALLLRNLQRLGAGESQGVSSVCVGRAGQSARRREESTKHREDAQSGVRGIQGRVNAYDH